MSMGVFHCQNEAAGRSRQEKDEKGLTYRPEQGSVTQTGRPLGKVRAVEPAAVATEGKGSGLADREDGGTGTRRGRTGGEGRAAEAQTAPSLGSTELQGCWGTPWRG